MAAHLGTLAALPPVSLCATCNQHASARNGAKHRQGTNLRRLAAKVGEKYGLAATLRTIGTELERQPASLTSATLAIVALLLLPAVARAGGDDSAYDPLILRAGECVGAIVGDGTRGPYLLPCPHANPATLSVTLRGDLLAPGVGYVLDLDTDTITLSRRLRAGDRVELRYESFPFALPRTLMQFDPDSIPEPDETLPIVETGPPTVLSPDIPSTLFITGSKTVGLRLGNAGEPAVEQSLRVTLFGEITDDIEVNGVLSDQSLPFQPEGTTTELDEIDKVFVEVRGAGFHTVLGDQVLAHDDGEWVRFQRRVSGARGELRRWSGAIEAAGTVTAGRFATQRFVGEEGNQGPYPLRAEGEIDILILAGSEHVWIDGIAMIRGEDRDYVIDYERGEIAFTSRRLITSEQEIVVDFEYSADRYRRTISVGRAEFEGRGIEAELLLFREGDDSTHPLFRTFDSTDLAAIAAAGDSAALAARDGALEVDPGTGDYLIEQQFDGRDGFTYSPGEGDYRVTFSELGVGMGEYRRELPYDGPVYFVYVGEGMGDYAPVVLLPLPARLEVADLRIGAEVGERVSLVAEGALSRDDPNQLSTNDVSNVGAAFSVSASLEPVPMAPGLGDWGRIRGAARARRRESSFRSPGRELDLATIEGWGFENSLGTRQKDRYDFDFDHEIRSWLRWGTILGLMGDGGDRTRRAQVELEAGGAAGGGFAAGARLNQVERRRGDSRRFRFREGVGRLGWEGARFSPSLGVEREERTDSLGARAGFDDLALRIAGKPIERLEIDAEQRWRWEDETVAGVERGIATSSTSKLEAKLAGRGALDLRVEAAHREREEGVSRVLSDLVRIESSLLPRSRVLAISTAYRFSGGEEELAVERYVPAVGDSLPGLYSYDPERGVYYFDPEDGVFARVIERTGERERVLQATLDADLRIHPERGEGTPDWLRQVAFEGAARIDEKSTTGERWDLALLRPSVLRVPGRTLRGVLDARGDLLIHPGSSGWNLRFRLATTRSLDDPGGTGAHRRSSVLRSARLRSRLGDAWLVEAEAGGDTEEELSNLLSIDRVGSGRFVTAELTRGPGRSMEFFVQGELRQDRIVDRGEDAELDLAALTPGVRFNLPRRGRARAEIGAEWLDAPTGTVPISVRAGREIGVTWRLVLAADYRVSEIVTVSGDYTGAVEPLSGVRNRGSLRVSAFF